MTPIPLRKAIGRAGHTMSVVLTDTLSTTASIPFVEEAGAVILVPTGYGGVSAEVYGCDTTDGTFLRLYDSDGNAVSMTLTAATAVQFPTSTFACHYLRLKLNTDDSTAVTIMTKG